MANILFSLFGWSFIPDFATKQLLNALHRTSILGPPQSPIQHRKQYALTFAFVVLGYLLYTIVQSARAMQPNFYQLLSVPYDVDENGLKLAFRAFAKRFHPDRPGVGKEGEAFFVLVRDAYEALKDPKVRAAYDRFGPEALAWRATCKTTRDFLHRGLMAASGYHIVTGIMLLFWSAIGQPSPVSFWRYVLFAALLAGELSFILSPFPPPPRPTFQFSSIFSSLTSSASSNSTIPGFEPSSLIPTALPSILQMLFPNRVPYQHILFLHQLFMFLSVALSRVVPYFLFLVNPKGDAADPNRIEPGQRAALERVFAGISAADREASLLVHTLLTSISPSSSSKPYHDPTLARMRPLSEANTSAALSTLTPEIENLVVEANIKNHATGPIAAVWEAALKGFKLKPAQPSTTPAADSCCTGESKGKASTIPGLLSRNGSYVNGRDENTPSPAGSTNSTPGPSTPLRTPLRSRNFWEKDVGPAEVDIKVEESGGDAPLGFASAVSNGDGGSDLS